jgi:hypothetical protein
MSAERYTSGAMILLPAPVHIRAYFQGKKNENVRILNVPFHGQQNSDCWISLYHTNMFTINHNIYLVQV